MLHFANIGPKSPKGDLGVPRSEATIENLLSNFKKKLIYVH
jgi:hypothetical protein